VREVIAAGGLVDAGPFQQIALQTAVRFHNPAGGPLGLVAEATRIEQWLRAQGELRGTVNVPAAALSLAAACVTALTGRGADDSSPLDRVLDYAVHICVMLEGLPHQSPMRAA
jgi:hypothetical protein